MERLSVKSILYDGVLIPINLKSSGSAVTPSSSKVPHRGVKVITLLPCGPPMTHHSTPESISLLRFAAEHRSRVVSCAPDMVRGDHRPYDNRSFLWSLWVFRPSQYIKVFHVLPFRQACRQSPGRQASAKERFILSQQRKKSYPFPKVQAQNIFLSTHSKTPHCRRLSLQNSSAVKGWYLIGQSSQRET